MSSIEKSNSKTSESCSAEPALAGLFVKFSGWFSKRQESFAAVGIRAVLLFGILCVIKLVMLVGFRRHLYEIHWRVTGQAFTWINYAAFYGFVVLLVLNLWRFSKRCQAIGSGSVRSANNIVLTLAAFFILLTLHAGDKNYLSPVMTGILSIPSLGWYLACDFLFRPPYLAAWIVAYAIAYTILAVTRRKHLALDLTALFAGVYVILSLQDWLQFRDALIIVDCFGIISLVGLLRQSRCIWSLGWIAASLLGIGLVFSMFTGWNTVWFFGRMNPEFLVISGSSLVVLGGVSLLARRCGFWKPWCGLLPFALATFLLLINVNYGSSANYNHLLRIGFTLSHYFLGEFVVSFFALLIAMAYRCWRPRGNLLWFDFVCLILLAWSLADLRVAQVLETRLDWSALSLAWGETPRMMWRMTAPYLPLITGVLAALAIVYALVLRLVRRIDFTAAIGSGPKQLGGAFIFILSFLMLGLAGNWLVDRDKANGQSLLVLAETSPLWRRAAYPVMDKTNFIETARELGMTQLVEPSASTGSDSKRDLNVVLIFQESTYNKYLSLFGGTEGTQPLLSRYKDQMELFPNFYSNFAGSIHARFAAFTGLYPVLSYEAFTMKRVPVKSIFEVLHENGYRNSLFYSSFFDYTGFRDFLHNRDIDEMYDADTMPGERKTPSVSWGLHEDETLRAIQNRIKQYAAERQKFFLTYIPAAPHNPFDGTPARFRKHQKENFNDFTPLYLNELLYMDWVIASICDQLKESGLLENTLVVITSDHGEMLGANGGPIGHGWAVNPELTNIPLIIMDPAHPQFRLNSSIGSQVDLLPTIAKRLGISLPQDQLYQGKPLEEEETNRAIYLNSFREYGIIEGSRMTCGERGVSRSNDTLELFPLTNRITSSVLSDAGSKSNQVPAIEAFDNFQENFLRNYAHYCEMMHAEKRTDF